MQINSTIKIVLAVSGGIAAYKCLELVRICQKQGFDVRVLMTEAATQLISKASFQALSHYPVDSNLWQVEDAIGEAKQHGMLHIELAKWADIILIAPATANRISKIATGQANDLLGNTLLATQAKTVIVPSMNLEMWLDPATQHNIQLLRQRNIHIWGPTSGEQACGDVGDGRMLEPQQILNHLLSLRQPAYQFNSLLITAGATQEAIDPVRFISNASSGKMGIELARQAYLKGVKTTLIHGAVDSQLLNSLPSQITKIPALSAQAMLQQCLEHYKNHQVMIGAAAVSDYRPANYSTQKIKQTNQSLTLDLEPNADIIKTIAEQEKSPFMVGFALETNHLLSNAQHKLEQKKLQLIFANGAQAINANESELTAFWQDGGETENKQGQKQFKQQTSSKQNKSLQAAWVLSLINQLFH